MDDRRRVLPIRETTQAFVNCINGLRIGKVVGIDAKGRFLVDYQGNDRGHFAASLTSSAREKLLQGFPTGQEVLLGFDKDDPSSPIIIDTLHSPLDEAAEPSNYVLETQDAEAIDVVRKRIMLDAEEEIVLKCGEASITLTCAGKVLIKGSYVISRSSGTNSIKGSSVRIN